MERIYFIDLCMQMQYPRNKFALSLIPVLTKDHNFQITVPGITALHLVFAIDKRHVYLEP